MSEIVVREISATIERERRFRILQQIFEQEGGEGSVEAFLEIGATDPQDGEERHWGNMTPEDRQLWLGLHATGLTTIPLPSDFKRKS